MMGTSILKPAILYNQGILPGETEYFFKFVNNSNFQLLSNTGYRLMTKDLDTAGSVCIRFYIHMFGQHLKMGRLTLYVENEQGERQVIWEISGNHGDQWMSQEVDAVIPDISSKVLN